MARSTRATLLTILVLALPAAPALAQSNPFGPLPQPAPATTPVPTATPSLTSSQDTGTKTLYIIGAVLLVAFAVIGVWIARDARRSLPGHHRGRHMMAEPAPGAPAERRRDPQAKAQARKKGRAQRRARRHNRP
jgi:hypothetical protein